MRPSQATIRNQRIRIRGKTSTKEKDSKSTRKDANDDSSDSSPSSSSRSSSTSRGSNPRRFRIRPAVGQNRGGEEVKKETEEDSAIRPRVSSPRRGSSGSRGRRPVAGRASTSKAPQRSSTLAPSTTITSTIPPTTTTQMTTTSEWTTTTEKVTINPNAHHISYTLDDAKTGGDDSLIEDVIVELGFPDYLEVEPDEEEETPPIAEELRSVVPVPADVFSQATHQLMKNKKITPDLNEPSFRPTLLPQRTTIGRRTGGTAGRTGETTGQTGATTGRRAGTTGRRIGGRRTSPRTIEANRSNNGTKSRDNGKT